MTSTDKPPTGHINCTELHIVLQTEVEHLQGNGPYACIYCISWEEKRDRKQAEFKVCVWRGADVPALLTLRAQEEGEWDPARADFSLHLSSPPPHSFISRTYTIQCPEACCRCECTHLLRYRWAVTQAKCAALQSLNCGSCEVKANVKPLQCWSFQGFHTSCKNWKGETV